MNMNIFESYNHVIKYCRNSVIYGMNNPVTEPIWYKNHNQPTSIDLMFTNRKYFQKITTLKTVISTR